MSMNKNKVSFNALLAFAVLEADFQDQQLSPSLRKMAQIPVTDQFTAGINQLIKKHRRGEKLSIYRRRCRRTIICISLLLSLVTCVFAPVKAVQDAVVSTVIEWNEKFSSIVFLSNDLSFSFPDEIKINYIPDGFSLSQLIDSENQYSAVYQNGPDRYCTIEIVGIEGSEITSWDNEHSSYDRITFDGREALWLTHETGNGTILLWTESNCLFQIITTETLDEAIKIARNISW